MGAECMSFPLWRESTQSFSSSCLFSGSLCRLSNFWDSSSEIINLLLWQTWWQFIKRLKHEQAETDRQDRHNTIPFLWKPNEIKHAEFLNVNLFRFGSQIFFSWFTFSADYKGFWNYFLPVKVAPCYNQVPAPVSFDRLDKLYALNLSVQGIFIPDLRSTL